MLVNEKGRVIKTEVVKSLSIDCDEAAVKAVRYVRWKPAELKGKPVIVWASVPIIFRLTDPK